MVIVPVGTAQVGCVVAEAPGAGGVVGAALIVTEVCEEVHPPAFLAVTLYVFGVSPLKVGPAR